MGATPKHISLVVAMLAKFALRDHDDAIALWENDR